MKLSGGVLAVLDQLLRAQRAERQQRQDGRDRNAAAMLYAS
jgi:hypothetical protein